MPNFSFKSALLRFNAGFLSARIGEWLFTVALNWAIFVQTESAFLLGVINACRLLPNLVLSVPTGVMADRYDRRKLNIVNAYANALLIVGVGLALTLSAPFWLTALLVVVRAVVTAAEGPWRNAYMCNIFAGERLKSAVAQSASVMNLGRIVGPVLAGALLASSGNMATFGLAALTTAVYGLVIQGLPAEDLGMPKAVARKSVTGGFRETLAQFPDLKKLLLLAVPVMFFGFPFTGMLPLVTEQMLGLGSKEFGTLLAISAAGALLASSRLAVLPDVSNWNNTRNYALLFGLSLSGLAFVTDFYSAAVVLFVVGYFGQGYRSCSRMLFQEIVPKERAGQMLGLALMDRGIIPVGGLLIGAVAEHFGAGMGVALMGVGCAGAVLGFYPLKQLKRPLLSIGTASVIALAVLFSGCKGEAPSATPVGQADTISVEHAWGTTDVPLKPQRIVVLDLSFLDALTALGHPVAGFAGTSDKEVPVYLKPELTGPAPTFVGERKQPNLEVILSLKPDLIIANPDRQKMIRQQLESIAPTVAFTDDSFQEVKGFTETLARVTGRESEYDALDKSLAESVKQATDAQKGQPGVLVVGAFEDEFSTWTLESFIGSLFTELGADYVFKGAPSASEGQAEVAKVTVESLVQLNPDILFVYGEPERWKGNPVYQQLSAYKDNKILTVDRDLWARARGPIAARQILEMYMDFLNSQEVANAEAR